MRTLHGFFVLLSLPFEYFRVLQAVPLASEARSFLISIGLVGKTDFAILRYLLLGVTYTGALLTLGFSFETLGWFATAASVGLGFGLQEIVANFVSGIILLLERPIRIGDTVTVGDQGGVVA